DLADALVDRDQHNVHHPHSTDAKREGTNEDQEHLQPNGYAINDRPELLASEHLDGLLIGGGETLTVRNCCQHLRLGLLLELRSNWSEDHHASVTRVPHLTRCRVGNEDRTIVTGEVIAHLQLAVHHSNNTEVDSVDQHILPHCRSTAKKLFADTSSDEGHAAMLLQIGCINPAPVSRNFVAHIPILGTDPPDCRIRHAVAVGNRKPLHCFKTSGPYQCCFLPDLVQISLLKPDFLSGSLASRLLAGLPRPADHRALAEGVETMHQN